MNDVAVELIADADLLSDRTSEADGLKVGKNRRESERFPVQGWAEVMTMDGMMMVRGQITDISLTGCFVESHGAFDLPLNSAVEMIFRIKGDEFRPEAVTRVVRSGQGAGFVFLKMNSKLIMQIEALIEILSVHL